MILRNQATGVSTVFPHFFPFFFYRHAKYTPDFETLCCVKIDDSMFEGVILEIVNIVQARSSAPCE